MRLYLNDKEAKLIRVCLNVDMPQELATVAHKIMDRMDLCDQLQNSENRSKYEGGFVYTRPVKE